MAKATDPAKVLAASLVSVLKAQRDLGGEAYPVPRDRLLALTDASAEPTVAEKAFNAKAFKDVTLVALPKHPAAPVAFKDDSKLLADSPAVLELALELTCTPARPAVPPRSLLAKLHKDLKKPFTEAVARRMDEKSLPATVGSVQVGSKPQLYLQRMPPRRPPAEELAEKLLRTLQSLRTQGGGEYPLLLSCLVALADPNAEPKHLENALSHSHFKTQVVFGVTLGKVNKDAPVALAADQERLAGSRVLLEFLLRTQQGEQKQAVPMTDLPRKAASAIKPLFEKELQRRIESEQLPPSIGWLWVGGKQHLFFLSDVHTAGREMPAASLAAPALVPSISPAEFAQAFEQAFQRLDREKGSHNFVSLVDLRHAVPATRLVFDAGLHELRRAGRFGLSAAEGRDGGVSAEQQAAGIVEDGALLLYVSRKAS